MPENELRDREDFIIYACELMRNRLVGDQIAERHGLGRDEVQSIVLELAAGSCSARCSSRASCRT